MLIKQTYGKELKGVRQLRLPVLSEGSATSRGVKIDLRQQLKTAYIELDRLQNELDQQRETRFQEGFESGKETGYKEALNEMSQQVKILAGLIESLQNQQENVVSQAEHFVVQFAFRIVEHLFGSDQLSRFELEKKRLGAMVQEAKTLLAESTKFNFRLNRAGCTVLEKNLDELKRYFSREIVLTATEDPSLKNGDCVIETDFGVLDGRIETQLKQMQNIFIEKLDDE